MTGPDARHVARAFRRAAAGYARADFLHAEIRARLLARLDPIALTPGTVLDLGAGPPAATADIAQCYPASQLLALDLVPEMLGLERRPWERIAGDAARLPLAAGAADLAIASMLLHWCEEPGTVLAEARRVLRYPGLFAFATLGPDTLMELQSAWAQADRLHHTLPFTDMHDLGDALLHAGFAEPVLDVETLTIKYRDIDRLVTDLRAVGAADLGPERRRSLTGRRRWQQMREAYESRRNAEGLLPATVEVIFGHAWSADPERQQVSPTGEFAFPVERLLRR